MTLNVRTLINNTTPLESLLDDVDDDDTTKLNYTQPIWD